MKKRPTPAPDPVQELMQQAGLHQPSEAFSTALTRLVVARYATRLVVAPRPKSWVGSVLMWLLAAGMLLLFSWLATPAALLSPVGVSVWGFVIGLGGIFWLLEHQASLARTSAAGKELGGVASDQ